jgi:hypothetical protein
VKPWPINAVSLLAMLKLRSLNMRITPTSAAIIAMLAVPGLAVAQSQMNTPSNRPASPAPSRPAADNSQPSQATYVTADKMTRASKVIGATVYNDRNESIGSVDELLIGANHDIEGVVLSVGGFLGINSKLVKVPADDIKVMSDRLVMSGATKDQLKQMPDYQFQPARAG